MQFLATVALSDCGHLTLCGHKGLSDGVHLKNDIDKSVTVFDNGKSVTVFDNGKSVTRDRLGRWLEPH